MPPLPIHSDVFRPLEHLGLLQKGGRAYYEALRRSNDPIIVVGAWCALLDSGNVRQPQWGDLVEQCRHTAVATRAAYLLGRNYEDSLAVEVLDRAAAGPLATTVQSLRAELTIDAQSVVDVEAALYLADGDLAHLLRAAEHAEGAGGWRESLSWAVWALAIAPLNPLPLQRIYQTLENVTQGDLMAELSKIMLAANLQMQIATVFAAAAELYRGHPDRCLARLKPLEAARLAANPALAAYGGRIGSMRSTAEEKLGHYKAAYAGFLAVNTAERESKIDPENFYRGIAARSRLPIPTIPLQADQAVVQMLGFPRSGTTLLENALAAHSAVETFEEVPALNAAIDRIERVLVGNAPKPEREEDTYLAARAKYYEQIERRRRKPEASVLVDKMPIRSAEADFISRLFPEWRYIFSIRHPFDVVLSCFKQRFAPNPAMENFRTIAGAIRAYDHTMTAWFKHFTLDDERVLYVRYDDLVTDFQPQMQRALDFLGLGWEDSVLDFAKRAEGRAAKTPSYGKVRQGLSIGVQTYWRNYDFLFDTPEAKPLHKWAQFFGYPTE